MRAQQNTAERVVAMQRSLILVTVLFSGCAHAQTEHVCNYKQLVNASKPPHKLGLLVTVDSGITFVGSERTLKVNVQSFDHGGICSVPLDRVTVTWNAVYGSEMPLSPAGNLAVFRPTLAGIYRLMVTAESPPLESRSELVSLPVITHEQNAVWHLKNTLQTAFSAEKARPPLTENLEQYKALLRAAYARLEAGEETDAIEQLEVFRKRLLTFHRGQSSWAAVIAEVDSLIEGFREADHRFDNWAIETGGGPL